MAIKGSCFACQDSLIAFCDKPLEHSKRFDTVTRPQRNLPFRRVPKGVEALFPTWLLRGKKSMGKRKGPPSTP